MVFQKKIIIFFMFIICFTMFTVCNDNVEGEDQNLTLTKKREDLKNEIYSMIEKKDCSEFSECKTIGFGSKPCGGHWIYLVYSTDEINTSLLSKKVEEYNKLDQKYNEVKGIVSDCMLVAEPEVNCVDGRCEIVR